MGKTSYPKLFTITLVILGCIFAFLAWRYEIEQETFLNSSTIRLMLFTNLFLAVLMLLALIKWGKGPKPQTIKEHFLLYVGLLLIAFVLSYGILTTLTWLLPGEISTYSSPYEYSSAGRHGCSGARLYDPDLQKEIKVCHPAGNMYGDKTIAIIKRTNSLGVVVTHAVTSP